jgi:hypothetical protein
LLLRLNYALHVEQAGFAIVPQCLSEQVVVGLCNQLGGTERPQRNLLQLSLVRELAVSAPVRHSGDVN